MAAHVRAHGQKKKMQGENSKNNVKSSKSRSDTAVQGTNDLSTLSKCSMAKHGYFADEFLHHFVAKECRRSPLIHRCYQIRSYVIDYLLKEFLKRTSSGGKRRQILSLGAGFDSTFFRLKSLGLTENCIFYEVDFPKVVKRKADIIEQIPELKSLIGNKSCSTKIDCAELFRDDYRLLGVDMTQVKGLDDAFRQSGTDVSCPTLILSECVLTYLTPQHSDAVIQWAAATFTNSVFVDYEQINPDTAFGSVMTRHFESNGSPLKCINTYRNIQSHKERFLKLGWSFCECSDMNTAYINLISEEEKKECEQLEPFDEFEEFHLTCCHYMILCAHKKDPQPYLYYTTNLKPETETVSLSGEMVAVRNADLKMADTQKTLLKRFGHSCILSSDGLLFIFGGFGKENGKFQRVSNLVIYDIESSKVISLAVPQNLPESHFSQMYQSICLSTDKSIILFAGRKSPGKANSSVTVIQVKNLEEASQKVKSGNEEKGTSVPSDFDFSLGSKSYKISCEELETKGDVPSPRWRHSSCIFEKNGLPMMFIYGGRDQHSATLNDGFVLDLQTKHWTKMEFLGDGEVPNGLHSHTCTTWRKDRYLVLAGGLLQSIPSHNIYLLDVSSFILKKLKISGTLYPRYSHTAHIVGDDLLLVGGVNLLPFSPGVAVINLLTGFSREFVLPVKTEFSEIEMVHNHQSIIFAESRQLCIIGGGGNCFSFGTHLNNSLIWIDLEQFGILENQK